MFELLRSLIYQYDLTKAHSNNIQIVIAPLTDVQRHLFIVRIYFIKFVLENFEI